MVQTTSVRTTMSKLYQRVREARKLTGLSQVALATDLGVTRSAVGQWEMAKGTAPSVENLIALAQRSGMAFEYLSTGRGTKIHGKPLSDADIEKLNHPNLSPQQFRLLAAFDRLTARQRSGLLELVDFSRHSPRHRV